MRLKKCNQAFWLLAALMLITFVPQFSLTLPKIMGFLN